MLHKINSTNLKKTIFDGEIWTVNKSLLISFDITFFIDTFSLIRFLYKIRQFFILRNVLFWLRMRTQLCCKFAVDRKMCHFIEGD